MRSFLPTRQGSNSDTYTLFKGPGEEFQNYLETIKGYSEIQTDPVLS